MVACITCGTELPDRVQSCPACGKPVQASGHDQPFIVQQPIKVQQPAESQILCPSCRRLVPNTTIFCPWCAGLLRPATTSVPQPVPAPEAQQPHSWYQYPEEGPHDHRAYKISIGVLLIVVVALGAVVGTMTFPRQSTPVLGTHPYSVVDQDFSLSWSGYRFYDPYLSVTSVKGSWIVPSMNCTSVTADQYSGFWVGIDGVQNDTGTLEQTGIIAGCTLANRVGVPVYDSFVEWYPAGAKSFEKPVSAGDKVTAEVSWNNDVFTATITDSTQGWTGTDVNSTIAKSALRASAEWIAEAPSSLQTHSIYPLANFDKVYFSNCFATTADFSGPMGSFNLVQDTMVDSSGYAKARSFLPFWNDGTSFSVWWMSAGP